MPRFQFSMWWLMVAVTVACVFLFLTVTFGGFFDALFASLLWCVLPTPVVIIAIYSRGDAQALAIGALIPWITFIVFLPNSMPMFFASIWLLPMSALCGVVAVATRRWIISNRRD